MLEAEAAAAACCIQRMARQVHTEGQQRQVAELLHRKRHERQQMSRHGTAQPSLDTAFEAPDPSRRSDPALISKAHLGQRAPAETLLKREEHRGVQLEERLRELQVRRRPLARATPCHAPLSTRHPLPCGTSQHAAPLSMQHPCACHTPHHACAAAGG